MGATERAPARCGTTAGYQQHRAAGEKPCDACTAAKADYDRRWRSAPDRVRRTRLHAEAQYQARRALVEKYADEYRELYLAGKKRLFAEHGLKEGPSR